MESVCNNDYRGYFASLDPLDTIQCCRRIPGSQVGWQSGERRPMGQLRERRHRRAKAPEPSPPEPADEPPVPPSCRLQSPASECEAACPCGPPPPPSRGRLPRTRDEGSPPARSPSRSWAGGGTALLLAAVLLSLASPALSLSPSSGLNSVTENGVCRSKDIRNSPRMFQDLSGCRVIEGFLHILLFDNYNESAYANISFPELREITHYLLLYRVKGMLTLATLFPNLAVIRGQKLFADYAFVVYQMMDLQEIGLYSLTDITRGAVRIEKNFKLCYVNTIDWNVIAPNGKDQHFIKDNKPDNECPVCPGDDGTNHGHICTVTPNAGGNNKRHLCWNQAHCQKICKAECGSSACTDDGKCCDPSCLGGCYGDMFNCTVCKDLSIFDLKDRKCIRDCPNNTFKHNDRRCITESECRSQPKPLDSAATSSESHPYKPINGTCMLECPANFYEEKVNDRLTCKPCVGICHKTCIGNKLDTIEAIQQMRGCTHIEGSLEISVKGGANIVKELEEGCGLIHEISGSLKVIRSFPLVSLNFLKNLKVIKGEPDEKNLDPIKNNALTVRDNQNLQELWDWEKHGPIDIQHGKLFFHFNPKLCIEKINPLRKMAKESDFSELEVARSSNGDKVACDMSLLNVTVAVRSVTAVLLRWDHFLHEDSRSLLGYVVHSIKAPYKNVTLFDGRDACGGDGWKLDDVKPDTKPYILHILTHLEPFTQYAVYVKTYTVATERLGAQSDIIYVTTLPGQPSSPRITEVVSLAPDMLMLKWLPPESPNGNITQYHVELNWEEDKEDFLRQRNYCNEPLVSSPHLEKKTLIELQKVKEVQEAEKKDCQCPADNKILKSDEEAMRQITFEDQLQNQVYQKREDSFSESRRRRDVLSLTDSSPAQENTESIVDKNGLYERYVAVVENQTWLNVTMLRHYATYSISVWVCREIDEEELKNDTVPNNCSIKAIVPARTMKLEGVDEVSKVDTRVLQSNTSLGMVRLTWKEPENPNSLIVTYHIQYNKVDIENHSPTTECITRQQFVNSSNSYIIKKLNPGNYSVKVMATSLAGVGNYSALKYFYIESSSSNMQYLVGSLIGAIVLVVVGLVGLYVWKRYFPPPAPPPTKLIASVNPEYVSTVYVPDEWEVPREKILMIKELGQGSFGMVWEGLARDVNNKDGKSELRCAVKTVNEHATDRERIEFLNEASVMKAFDTAHVVRLLGVVSRGQPTLVVMELMANGDLKSYLRSHRPDAEKPRSAQPPTLARILQMAMEIADGMAYLSAKKFVHRDLAARNCMVADDLTVKVGDFGMTRDIYETDYYRKGSKGLLPVRWMSPESLKDGVFTSSSDVWSYGVVLWEMATLASQPYQGLSNDQVLRYVIDGGVMERPENCPDRLYHLMQMTWQHRSSARPTFLQLVAQLATEANSVFRANSFFFSTQGQEMLNQVQPQSAAGVSEEPERSTSAGLNSWARELAPLDSDISPGGSAPPSPQLSSSYRDIMRLVPFGERARAAPHETEALVQGLSQSAPPKPSPPAQTTPNGYLPRSNNNGNPSSLSTSRC